MQKRSKIAAGIAAATLFLGGAGAVATASTMNGRAGGGVVSCSTAQATARMAWATGAVVAADQHMMNTGRGQVARDSFSAAHEINYLPGGSA